VNRALRAATIGVLLIAPVALSSCSAGQIPQTSSQNRDKVGAGATIGAIALREVKLLFPTGGTYSQGGDAELSAAIINGGSEPDTLAGVTGNDFTGVRVAGTGSSPLSTSSSALTSVPGSPVGTVPPGGLAGASTSGSSSPSSSAAATTTAAGGAATSPTAAGPTTAATGIAGATGTPTATAPSSSASSSSGISLAVPPDTSLYLGQNSPHVFVTGLTRSLTAGQNVRITFTFQKAGSVAVDAFVAGPASYVPNSSSFDFNVPTKANEPGNAAGGGGVSGGNG
jgi:Copper chaperone PCu(A)C